MMFLSSPLCLCPPAISVNRGWEVLHVLARFRRQRAPRVEHESERPPRPLPAIMGPMGMDSTQHFDSVVIGSGLGGMAAARMLAQFGGKRVLVLEQHYSLGG